METYLTKVISRSKLNELFDGLHGHVDINRGLRISITYHGFNVTWLQYDLHNILKLDSELIESISSMRLNDIITFTIPKETVLKIIGLKLNIDTEEDAFRSIVYDEELDEFQFMMKN